MGGRQGGSSPRGLQSLGAPVPSNWVRQSGAAGNLGLLLIPEPVTHDVFPCNKHEPVLPNSPDTPRNIALTSQVEVLSPFIDQLSVSPLFLFLPFVCHLLLGRSVTPFVSITSLSEQRSGGPTCRSPGAGLCSPRASQDYPQRRRQLRPGEEAINLHKLQQATLPPLSLDTQIMHLLLNSVQTDSRGDKSIS
ncbi:hypothetical protein NQZ68_014465 [Dissostichus eleginoides]|nr:hypothetical protein NQZ68_014465 [Dissostichus eleginoides]